LTYKIARIVIIRTFVGQSQILLYWSDEQFRHSSQAQVNESRPSRPSRAQGIPNLIPDKVLKNKVLTEQREPRAEVISVSVAPSQTPAYMSE